MKDKYIFLVKASIVYGLIGLLGSIINMYFIYKTHMLLYNKPPSTPIFLSFHLTNLGLILISNLLYIILHKKEPKKTPLLPTQ